LVAIGYAGRPGTSMHQIEFSHIAYQDVWVALIPGGLSTLYAVAHCPRSDVIRLPIRVAEFHLLQRVTPKRSWTITIFLRNVIVYGCAGSASIYIYNIIYK